MHARYYSVVAGRFLSSDTGSDWDLREPESWNGFSYVRNTPIIAIDPDGLQIVITADRPSFTLMDGFLAGLSNAHQLDNLSRAINQLERLSSLRNPVTGMTAGQHWQATGQGAAAFVDELVPFGDPLEDHHGDGSVSGLGASTFAGRVTQEVAWAATGGQLIRLTKFGYHGRLGGSLFQKADRALGIRAGSWNQNSAVRAGWGWNGRYQMFRVVVGPRKWPLPNLRHVDFW
jgi:hypothetical protein